MSLCMSSFQWGTTNEVLWKFTSGIYRGYGHFTKWGYLGNLYDQMITTYFQESSTLDCEGKRSCCLLFGYAVNFSLYSCQEIWILTSSACLEQLHELAVHFSSFCWHMPSFFCPFAYFLFLSFFLYYLTQFHALGSGDFGGMRWTHIPHSLFKLELPHQDHVSLCCIQKSQQNRHCCLPSFLLKLDLHSGSSVVSFSFLSRLFTRSFSY